jgi:Zn-dependent hydrolases, including glyoxylases
MMLSTNPCNVYIEKDTLIDCSIAVDKRIKTILLTHCHFDHVLQVKKVKEKNNAKVVMQRDDAEAIEKRMLHRVFIL